MDSKLATSGLQALVTELRLRASTTTDSLEARANAILLYAAVEYLLLKADATVGDFIDFINLAEAFSTQDAVSLLASKPFTDAQTTTDQLVAVLAKVLADGLNTSDEALLNTDKPLTSAALVADIAAKTFGKLADTDFVTAADYSDLTAVKNFPEVAYAAEGPGTGQIYADLTYFAEDYVREGFPTRGFFKVIGDTLDATDDFLGVANVDDDQIIFFGKSRMDHAVTSEVFSRAFTTSRTDGVSPTDIVLLATSRPAASAFVAADSTVKTIGKTPADTATSADAGALRMTDYADISYFAQDYVGTAFSF
jgi:hypothetical protein